MAITVHYCRVQLAASSTPLFYALLLFCMTMPQAGSEYQLRPLLLSPGHRVELLQALDALLTKRHPQVLWRQIALLSCAVDVGMPVCPACS